MPVRSLNSSVLKWPDAELVHKAFMKWARAALKNENVTRTGYFGSYARGNAGPGSDLDVVIILKQSDKPFERRRSEWDMSEIPVPVDVLIYTLEEWEKLDKNSKMTRMLRNETVWANESE